MEMVPYKNSGRSGQEEHLYETFGLEETGKGTPQTIPKETGSCNFNSRFWGMILAISAFMSITLCIATGYGVYTMVKNELNDAKVHGSWSDWAGWGSCSVTCGIGIQSRDRSCSNPPPSRYGDHCFGANQMYRICSPGACAADGHSGIDRARARYHVVEVFRHVHVHVKTLNRRNLDMIAHETTACRTSQCPSYHGN